MRFFKQLYIAQLFFFCLIGIIVCFILSFVFPNLYHLTWYVVGIFSVLVSIDALLLFSLKSGLQAKRNHAERFSNGDENDIHIYIQNRYTFPISVKIIDEIPFQFQERNFLLTKKVQANSEVYFTYFLRPVERGEYHFGNLNVYVSSPLGFVSKRYTFDGNTMVPTYPSYIQLRKYDLIAFSNQLIQYGTKKIRKVGYSMEFEQIKEYVQGDDIRHLNWKATAKKQQLMVNQFQTERSQNIYMIIDKGRVMRMPFRGLSLLDYAINASLVLSNVILKKEDKAGLFTFSKKVENRVVAEKRSKQMNTILETLYNITTNYSESDFGRLYADIKRNISHRSLILLYTNFETIDGLHRQLPYLKGIAKHHLLVVVFFQNTELHEMVATPAKTVQEIYDKAIAEKFIYEKKRIVNELKKYGIYSLLTKPENLTLDSINQYIEIKSRGLI